MKEIPLTQNKVALIDDEDYELINNYKWFVVKDNNTYYAITKIYLPNGKRTNIPMHRMILGLKHYDGKIVDHINRNGLDNRRLNIRVTTQQQNRLNSIGKRGSSSKYKGVVHRPHLSKKWTASIYYNKKLIHLGYFLKEEDAAWAYDVAALKLFGKFAYTNMGAI